MNYVIFGIILLHLVVGFGWLIYKLEFQKEKPKDKETTSATEVTKK